MENHDMKVFYTLFLFNSLLILNLCASETLYKPCISCHGLNGEKRALGKSKIIVKLPKEEIITALEGYKDGTYGGPFKKIMQEQTIALTQNDILTLSDYINSLKKVQ